MELFRRAPGSPNRLGIFPGSFNPATAAHLALAHAALEFVDEVAFVLPRAFPHKRYEGAPFEARLAILTGAAQASPRFSVVSTGRGLFAEIAEEFRAEYGPAARLSFLCGRDAAERAMNWDYGAPGAFEKMLERFDLLVAARGGEFTPAERYQRRVERIELPREYQQISATELRRRIRAGEAWESLAPEGARELIRAYYG